MYADLVITNGNVRCEDAFCEAVAIKGKSIIAVGAESEIAKYISKDTKVIDAEKNDVMPAFTDAHLHPSMACSLYEKSNAFLYDCFRENGEGREEYIDRCMSIVKNFADEHKEFDVVRGSGWYPAAFTSDPEGAPTRHDVDRYISDRPVILKSFDCHSVLVNTKALELAGVDENTPTPRGGEMPRDEKGYPTGLFSEMPGIDFITEALPGGDYSVEELKTSLMDFQHDYALPSGITTVFDALVYPNTLQAYLQLAREETFKLKVNANFYADPRKGMEQFDTMVADKGKYDVGDRLIVNTVKFFIDGGAMGMYMAEPFEKEILKMSGLPEDYRGDTLWTQDELNEAVLKLSKAGYQIHIHTIGDGAVRMALDAFENAENSGVKGNRNVVTHIQNILPEDVERMKKLNVIAAVQPAWACNDSFVDMAMVPLVGEERAYDSYPYGELSNSGILVTCSSDFPVSPKLSPLQGIKTGVSRILSKESEEYDAFVDKPLGPADDPMRYSMKLDDVIDGYTKNAAFQLFRENTSGKIAEGMTADLIIFDRKIAETDILDVEDIKIKTLIIDGEIWND